MKHDELQHDLAEFRRACGEMVAEKVALGSFGTSNGNPEMDVAAIKPSWTQPNPTCYEVKASRADFLADTQAGKYRNYLPYVRKLYFAAESGMLAKADVPEGCGLIVRGDNGWHVVKAPRVLALDPERWPVLLQAVLMKHYPGPWSRRTTRAERIEAAEGTAVKNVALRFRGLELSRQVRAAFADAQAAARSVEALRDRVARALGEESGDRDLEELVQAVLDRRPPAPAPSLSDITWNLKSAQRSIELALANVDKRTSAKEGAV